MGREMKRQMKLFKEFCKDTIFTYEWSEFCERGTYIEECMPDNNMVTVATSPSSDTKRHDETHHDTL